MTETKSMAFTVNDLEAKSVAIFPSFESLGGTTNASVGITDVGTYVTAFEGAFGKAINGEQGLAKSVAPAPNMVSFGRMSYMPESYNSGVLQKPGIAFESLSKIARENLLPQMIICTRVDDVLRYSQLSTHPWRPGWQIEVARPQGEEITAQERKDVLEAERFVMMSNTEMSLTKARERDAKGMRDFQGFLSCITRDSLTYDGIAVWTDMTVSDKVKGYVALPSSRIRLTQPGGYLNNPEIFAVAVDDNNKVIHQFTRDELIYYVRNVRAPNESLGYGWSEIEIAVRLIQGFQNAVDMNINTFNQSSIPNGLMVISGQVTQKQVDLMSRLWGNLKKGVTKAWALPVMGLPSKDSKIEIINLSDIKGMEAYYQDFMNMIAGAFCTIYRFPVRRLGYRISGKGRDTEPAPDQGASVVDDDDPGLAPLLIHLENVINEYLIWNNWPHLRFRFNGKSPKEDAREIEAKKLARTWAEERAEVGLPSFESLIKKLQVATGDDGEEGEEGDEEDDAFLARMLSLMPADPARHSAFAQLVQIATGDVEGDEQPENTGPPMMSRNDPAKKEQHGGTAGVRRNSRKEKKKQRKR